MHHKFQSKEVNRTESGHGTDRLKKSLLSNGMWKVDMAVCFDESFKRDYHYLESTYYLESQYKLSPCQWVTSQQKKLRLEGGRSNKGFRKVPWKLLLITRFKDYLMSRRPKRRDTHFLLEGRIAFLLRFPVKNICGKCVLKLLV